MCPCLHFLIGFSVLIISLLLLVVILLFIVETLWNNIAPNAFGFEKISFKTTWKDFWIIVGIIFYKIYLKMKESKKEKNNNGNV
jgi:hypothetical protein